LFKSIKTSVFCAKFTKYQKSLICNNLIIRKLKFEKKDIKADEKFVLYATYSLSIICKEKEIKKCSLLFPGVHWCLYMFRGTPN